MKPYIKQNDINAYILKKTGLIKGEITELPWGILKKITNLLDFSNQLKFRSLCKRTCQLVTLPHQIRPINIENNYKYNGPHKIKGELFELPNMVIANIINFLPFSDKLQFRHTCKRLFFLTKFSSHCNIKLSSDISLQRITEKKMKFFDLIKGINDNKLNNIHFTLLLQDLNGMLVALQFLKKYNHLTTLINFLHIDFNLAMHKHYKPKLVELLSLVQPHIKIFKLDTNNIQFIESFNKKLKFQNLDNLIEDRKKENLLNLKKIHEEKKIKELLFRNNRIQSVLNFLFLLIIFVTFNSTELGQ